MPNCTSKLASSINDQYFTPVETAMWCFDQAKGLLGWDFKGTVLEPSVGAYAFVKASDKLKLPLDWTTNDLFPQPLSKPDYELDWCKEDIPHEGRFDYVITNPPFGVSNTMAKRFMKKALKAGKRVMMILPKGSRRVDFQDSMPLKAKKVLDINLEDMTFVTSTGERKIVQCCLQCWERTNVERVKIKDSMDLRKDLFVRWSSEDDKWQQKDGMKMDVQVTRWGRMGRIIPAAEERKSGSLQSVHLRGISKDDFVSIQESLNFDDYYDMSVSTPAFDVVAWVHRFNTEAVKRGLLPPC